MNNISSSKSIDLYNISSSTTERVLLATWCLLAMTTSLIGNSIVLLSSLKYKAIRLDKITLVLIENIAIADMGYACYIASTLTSIIANRYYAPPQSYYHRTVAKLLSRDLYFPRWMFGDVMCSVFNYMHLYFGMAEMFLICALNISKLSSLLFPLQARARSSSFAKLSSHVNNTPSQSYHHMLTMLLRKVIITCYQCSSAKLLQHLYIAFLTQPSSPTGPRGRVFISRLWCGVCPFSPSCPASYSEGR